MNFKRGEGIKVKYVIISDPRVLVSVDVSAMHILYPWGTYMCVYNVGILPKHNCVCVCVTYGVL